MFKLRINPVVRAIAVIGSVAGLVTGVTFAALNSQATLTDNTIASATADLQVDNTDDLTTGLGSTDKGYTFTGIVPGGSGSNTGNFQLKNNGTAALGVTVRIPTATVFTGTVTHSKVRVVIQRGAQAPQEILLSDLEGVTPVTLTGGNIAPGATESFTVQVKMDADAFTGSGTSTVSSFSFQFDATGV